MMQVAYWNDHGCRDLIPGGDSRSGHYHAVAEEEGYLLITSDTKPYVESNEYGYNYKQSSVAYVYPHPDLWNHYKSLIDSTHQPVTVAWNGEPYGSHSTLGVVYKIVDSMRFLILHDTWSNTPCYVNYDEYENSISQIKYYSLDTSNAQPKNIDYSNITLGKININLEKVDIPFSPDLTKDLNAYHNFIFSDIFSDGNMEFISVRYNNHTDRGMSIYNNNNNNYEIVTDFNPEFNSSSCFDVIKICDIDNNNEPDIIVTGYCSGIYLFKNINKSYSNYYTEIVSLYPEYGSYTDLDIGDIDSDGAKDFVTSTVDGRILVYKNHNNNFTKIQTIYNLRQSLKVKLADLNNDGLLDIVTSFRSKSIAVFYNNNGVFNSQPDFAYNEGHGALTFAIGDIDNDGFEDIVTINDGDIIIFYNNKDTLSQQPVSIRNIFPCYSKDMLLTDLNKDGYPDLIIANFNTPNCIYMNYRGQFESKPSWVSTEVDPSFKVVTWFSKDSTQEYIGFGKSFGSSLDFYKVGQTTVSVKNREQKNILSEYNLFQNYPNPFNPTTTIEYTIPKESFVTIKVYDVLGKEIETLVNERKPIGNYSVDFNSGNISSGIYFYRIVSGTYTLTKKMVILR